MERFLDFACGFPSSMHDGRVLDEAEYLQGQNAEKS